MITGALVREARPARRARAAARDDVRLIKAKEASLGMKVCVVGCGAVGSLFAANLATLDDVEVWAYDLAQEHVDAINRDGLRLTGAGEVVGRPRATTDAAELPAVRLRHRRDEGDAHRGGDRARPRTRSRTAASRRCRTGSATRRCSRAHVERVIRGTTFPAGKITAPGVVQWDVKGDTTFGPFEDRSRRRSTRSSGSPTRARAAACRRRRSRTRAGRSGAR